MDEAFLFLPRKFLDVPQSTSLFFGRDHCFGSVCMGSIRVWIRPFLIWLGEVFGCATEHYCFFLEGKHCFACQCIACVSKGALVLLKMISFGMCGQFVCGSNGLVWGKFCFRAMAWP